MHLLSNCKQVAVALLGVAVGACGSAGGNDNGSMETNKPDPVDPSLEPCPGGGLSPGNQTFVLTHDGIEYSYIVHVPSGYDDAHRVPLVLNWHGMGMTGDLEESFTAMDPVSDAHGFIVVYPTSPSADGRWDAGPSCNSGPRDDVGFARTLVADMQVKACVDPRRVYSTGFSYGGFMSHRLACDAADLFAAVAPVAGMLCLTECNPSRPVPILHFHGTEDTIVYYDGGNPDLPAIFTSVPVLMQGWADRDGCKTGPTETFVKDDAHLQVWTDCSAGVEVGLFRFESMGHCWPGQAYCPFTTGNSSIPSLNMPATSLTVNASEEIAKFFERWRLP